MKKSAANTRHLWDRLARDWYTQVGDEGDSNRRLNSDPVCWEMAGDVHGLAVLDAGCGTGYLLNMLAQAGAEATGVDFSNEMIAFVMEKYPGLDARVDDCTRLETIGDNQVDLLISNYVLMDLPDIDNASAAFFRVLKPGGAAVIVISHPCFPQAQCEAQYPPDNCDKPVILTYTWDFPYFEQAERIDPPWNHFKEQFVRYHRPLSAYWRAFTGAGFTVVDFREPRIEKERFHLAVNDIQLQSSLNRPFSVVFKLEKPG